jgi:hypothetical protein
MVDPNDVSDEYKRTRDVDSLGTLVGADRARNLLRVSINDQDQTVTTEVAGALDDQGRIEVVQGEAEQFGVSVDGLADLATEESLTAEQPREISSVSAGALDVSAATVPVTNDGALDVSAAPVAVDSNTPLDVSAATVPVTGDGPLDASGATVPVTNDGALDVSAATITVTEEAPVDVSASTVPVEAQTPVALENAAGTQVDPLDQADTAPITATDSGTGAANAAALSLGDLRTDLDIFVDVAGAATLTVEVSPDGGATWRQFDTVEYGAATVEVEQYDTSYPEMRAYLDANRNLVEMVSKGV